MMGAMTATEPDPATRAGVPAAEATPPAEPEDDVAAATAPDAAAIVEQGLRAAVGAVVLAVTAVAESIRQTLPSPPPTDERGIHPTDALALLTGATLGATVAVGEALASRAGDLVRATRPVVSWWIAILPTGSMPGRVRSGLEVLDERWRATRPASEEAAAGVARELVPQVVDAVFDQFDLTWLIAERVDLDAVVARVDLDAVADRIDVERILARVVLDRVAARIDVDAVAARVDLDALIGRIDLAAIATQVIDELDLASLIRESTEAVSAESVRGLRVQSANADRAVRRVADRVLGRAPTADGTPDDEPPAS
jgi:hypothetical protein